MTTETKSHTPWFLWPFVALWKLLAVIVEMTGRFVAMVLGLVFIVVGIIVSLLRVDNEASARRIGGIRKMRNIRMMIP